MAKTPLKQGADQTLVQGAYRAALAPEDGMGQGMDDLMKIGTDLIGKIQTARKEKRKEGDDLADSILEVGGSLGTSWLDAFTGEVEGMHSQYDKDAKRGRKNKTAKGIQDLNTLSAEAATLVEMTAEMAEAQKQKDWSGSVGEKEQSVFNAFMNNNSKKRMSKDEDGKRVIEVETPSGWMSTSDINRMMQEHKKDYITMAGVRDQIIKAKEAGGNRSKDGAHLQPDYDTKKSTAQMESTLRNANIKSLMHDDVLENGTPWITAVADSPDIVNMTYESLGMKANADGAFEIDTDGDGKPDSVFQDDGDGIISKEEAQSILSGGHKQLIVDALTNPENEFYDEDRTRKEMAKYFTQSIQKNYMDGYNSNANKPVPTDQGEQMHVQNSDGSYSPVSPASDQLKDLSTEELLAMYPPKQ